LTLLGIGLLVVFRIRGDVDLGDGVAVAAGPPLPPPPGDPSAPDPFGPRPDWSTRAADGGLAENGHRDDDPATDRGVSDSPGTAH
jgi:hypothetical protein